MTRVNRQKQIKCDRDRRCYLGKTMMENMCPFILRSLHLSWDSILFHNFSVSSQMCSDIRFQFSHSLTKQMQERLVAGRNKCRSSVFQPLRGNECLTLYGEQSN